MGNFFSAVMTKDKIYSEFGVNSHKDIIAIHGLREGVGRTNFVLIEMLPPSPMHLRFDEWRFKVDQDIVPDWFDATDAKAKMIRHMESLPKIAEDIEVFAGRAYFCTARVGRMVGSAAISLAFDTASVDRVSDNASVDWMYDNASVGWVFDNARVGAVRDNASVGGVYDNASVDRVHGNARVGAVYGNARVGEMYDNASVDRVYGNARVGLVHGYARVDRVYGNARVGAVYGNARVGEMYDNARLGAMLGLANLVNDMRARNVRNAEIAAGRWAKKDGA
jgi:hypothetical protein